MYNLSPKSSFSSSVGNGLFNSASLDLHFAKTKSLVDATTGTNLIDFTRASSGTYVGSDGLIKTATTNLLSWSEDFTNAVWQATNPGEVTVITGVADPLGGVNATTLFHDSGAGDTGWLRRVNTGIIGLSYTLSFWIRRRSGSGDFFAVVGDNINQTISGITSEWQRVFVSNVLTSTTLRTYFKVDSAGDEFDIFGAQLEQSSTVGEYIKTTSTINSAPRFDHDPTTGESLGLLVEEQRTNLLVRSEEFGTTWIPTRASVSTNDIAAPDGTLTADKLVEDTTAANIHFIQQTSSVVSGTSYTLSVFVKAAERSEVNIQLATGFPSTAHRVNLSTGATINTSGSPLATSVQALPNGWYRISVTQTANLTTSVSQTNIYISVDGTTVYTGDGTSGIYLWGAQLEEGSFPTSYIPTEGTTVTRAADVADISGNNFGAFNLLQYSEEFDDASWVNSGTLVTANTAVAPDGTLTADTLTPDALNLYQTFSNAITTYTASVFIKSVGATSLTLALVGGGAGLNGGVVFSFATNTESSTGTVNSVSSQSIGNGWYRVTATLSATGTASPQFRLTPTGGDVYIWGAQLEQSDVVTPYIKSDVTFTSRASSATYYDANGTIQTAAVDEARTNAYLPDDSGNLVSAGELLLEGAATNLLLRSEEFDSASWTKSGLLAFGSGSVADATTAPDGSLTADLLTESTASGAQRNLYQNAFTASPATLSCYVKPNGRNFVGLRFYNSSDNWVRVTFSLTGLGAATDVFAGTSSSYSATSASISLIGDGWYRVSLTATKSGGINFAVLDFATTADPVLSPAAGTEAYDGDGTSGIYLWGAQLEASPYATSYIPTAGSQVTRAADVSTSSSNTFGNSWYRQDEGTVFASIVGFPIASGQFPRIYDINDGTANNAIRSQQYANNRVRNNVFSGGTTYMAQDGGTIAEGSKGKTAFALAENNCAIVTNGGAPVIDNTVTMPNNLDRMDILSITGGTSSANSTISRLTYWPTRLPNETLQTITK